MDISIKIDASDALRALGKLDEDKLRPKIANAVADDVVLPALSKAKYPPASRKKQPFKSDASRRFFFAALKSGAIDVPYHRSGKTGTSYEKHATAQGIDVTSTRPSAAYTRGGGPLQAAYHKGTWDTHEELARKLEPEAEKVGTQVVVDEIGM